MKAKKKKNENFFARLIGVFFLVSSTFFCGYVMFEDKLNLNEEGQADFSSVRKVNDLDTVNEHLKSVSDKMELERMKALVANMKVDHSNVTVRDQVNPANENQPIIDFSDDPRIRQLAEDFGRTTDLKKRPQDPRSIVYNSVIEDRALQKQKEVERRQQALEFVSRARKDGWIVKLDENYKIKSYRRADEDTSGKTEEIDYKGYEVIPK